MRAKRAVYDTIRTRMDKQRTDACSVVLEPFQFTGQTKKRILNVGRKSLTELEDLSRMKVVCKRCEWFHSHKVSPEWRHSFKRVYEDEMHIFYRRK